MQVSSWEVWGRAGEAVGPSEVSSEVKREFDFKVLEPPSGAAERQLQGCGDAQSKSCASINPNFNGMENGAKLPLEMLAMTPTLKTNELQ